MTCIIGYNDKKNKKIYIIGDSAGVSGLSVTIRDDKKVFRNGSFLIGFTSSFRMGQVLQHMSFPEQGEDVEDFKYMCTDFIDAVMDKFSDKSFGEKINDEKHGGVFMVGYKSNLYTIHSDYQVALCKDGFDSVGCGEKFALGALHALGDDKKSIPERLERAMDIVVKLSGGVRPPYVLEEMSY